jgi:hypothetical protein
MIFLYREDPRIKLFNVLFDSPEEELVKNGMTVGILGLPRDNFDPMLVEKLNSTLCDSELSTTTKSSYQSSQLTDGSDNLKQQLLKMPDVSKEETVPVNFPHNNTPSPDLHFEQREDAKKMWKLNKTQPTV